MDISGVGAASSAMSAATTSVNVSAKMLSNAMDLAEDAMMTLLQSMSGSGTNIDTSV